jgi:UMF1 family MFS transporter
MAAVLPIYFHDVAASVLPEHERTAYWGYTSAVALLIAALISPLLGAYADLVGSKKKFIGFFTALGVVATLGLWWVGPGDYQLAAMLYILGNIGFAGGLVFYDALLPGVAKPEDLHRVSTAGYAIGYLGGGMLLAINLLWITKPEWFGIADKGMAVKLSFVSVGIWWAVFSLPLLHKVPEPPVFGDSSDKTVLRSLRLSLDRLVMTAREMSKYRQIWIFLVSFWFYSDGIGTIIKMATTYGREVGIGANHLIGALLLVQFVGIPATFVFGKIADRLGPKPALQICLFVYTMICLIGYFMSSPIHFWALAVLVALVQGGSQAISRSLYAMLVPADKLAEFFSFMSVSSRFAGILGPFVFGLTTQLFGSSQISILMLVSFFVIGSLLLYFVDIKAGQAAAFKSCQTP